MKSVLQVRGMRFSAAIIVLTWLWQIIGLIFPHEPALRFFLPRVDMMTNLPLGALYAMGTGIGYLFIMIFLLNMTGEHLADLGFHREQLFRQVSIGAGFGFCIFILNSALLLPLIETVFPKFNVSNSALFSSNLNIAILFFLGIVKGGLLEELWRIFVVTRFEKVFQRAGLVLALIISSALFGLGHSYQGKSAIIGTAVIGLLNGIVYLRKRNAIEAVVAHAFFDILAVAAGAMMYSGH